MRWNSKDNQIQIDMSKNLSFSKKVDDEELYQVTVLKDKVDVGSLNHDQVYLARSRMPQEIGKAVCFSDYLFNPGRVFGIGWRKGLRGKVLLTHGNYEEGKDQLTRRNFGGLMWIRI